MGAIFLCFRSGGSGRLRRGQDPSLRGKRYMGGNGKVEGRACPAPTDCCENLRTRGAREGGSPPLLQWAGAAREWMATQGPSESPSHLTVTAPFDKGASLSPLRGFGGTPDFLIGVLRGVQPPSRGSAASKQRQFSLVLSFAAKRKNNLPGDCRSRFTAFSTPCQTR